jgi:hypothetical protein
MQADFDEMRFEIHDGTQWVDVSADVVGEHEGEIGGLGNDISGRVGQAGELRFSLRNSVNNQMGTPGWYSPGWEGAMPGFDVGAEVRLTYVYDTLDKQMWHGRIPDGGITVESGMLGPRRTKVRCVDVMNEYAKSLELPTLASSKTMDDVADLVTVNLGITLPNRQRGTMAKVFPTVFDTTRQVVAGVQEMAKAVLGEWGWAYVKQVRGAGTTLVTEGRYDRATAELQRIPLATPDCAVLELTDGSLLELSDGSLLALSEREQARFDDNDIRSVETVRGASLINQVRITLYPRYEDSDNDNVLWELEEPLLMDQLGGPYDTREIRVAYRAPGQEAQTIVTKDMKVPEWTANTKKDGTGINVSAYVTVEAEYGAAEGKLVVRATYHTDVWVRTIRCKGRGIYLFRAVDVLSRDEASQETYRMVKQLNLSQRYMADVVEGQELADHIISIEKDARNNVVAVNFTANHSPRMMMAALVCEPGSLVEVAEEQSRVSGWYFVQSKKWSTFGKGRFVRMRWSVIEAERCGFAS